MTILNLVLPGNPRYQPASLGPIFGYDRNYVPVGEVELATMQILGEIGVISPEDMAGLTEEVRQAILGISTTEVDAVERRVTRHDIRAWVRLAQPILPVPLRRWVHIPLTSYDPLDTARIIQFLRAYRQVVRPRVKQLVVILAELVERYADQAQIGRTHGQHALPITVGFWLACILNRIMVNAQKMEETSLGLVGKISGAVGAYNAPEGLGIEARCGPIPFEDRVLRKVDLGPGAISTQILQPEPLTYHLFACLMLSAALGQLGRDCRQLMRSEIDEVEEAFEAGQVGSSTMPNKRNPINFEQLEGMWLKNKHEFGKVLETLISEHQRDLVGSSLMRDFPTLIVNLVVQLETLLRANESGASFLARMRVNEEACARNLRMNAGTIIGEPLQIALQMAGYLGDAHAVVNERAMPLSKQTGLTLVDCVQELALSDDALAQAMQNIPEDVLSLLMTPEQYTGRASASARRIAGRAGSFLP